MNYKELETLSPALIELFCDLANTTYMTHYYVIDTMEKRQGKGDYAEKATRSSFPARRSEN